MTHFPRRKAPLPVPPLLLFVEGLQRRVATAKDETGDDGGGGHGEVTVERGFGSVAPLPPTPKLPLTEVVAVDAESPDTAAVYKVPQNQKHK